MIGGGVTEVHFVGYVPLAPTLLKLFLRLIINFILDILGECNNLRVLNPYLTEFSYSQNTENVRPILVTLLKLQLRYISPSGDNANPSSATSASL